MLRGKFGQLGGDLGDGHVTMDAFQQAAFRDHIRSGERIMFLAATGRLKHKKTRNTIAAEPTPRSSCPSARAGPSVGEAATATSGPGVQTAPVLTPRCRDGRNSRGNDGNTNRRSLFPSCWAPPSRAGDSPDRRSNTPARAPEGLNGVEDDRGPCASPPRSPPPPSPPLLPADSPEAFSDPRKRKKASDVTVAEDQPLPAAGGRLGASRVTPSADLGIPRRRTSKPARSGHRARSAGLPGRRSQHPGACGTFLRRCLSDASTVRKGGQKPSGSRAHGSKTARLIQPGSAGEESPDDVPLHVGPVISDVDGVDAGTSPAAKSGDDEVARKSLNRPRPASAGPPLGRGRFTAELRRRAGPPRIVKRGFEDKGGNRGAHQHDNPRTLAAPNARLSSSVKRSPSTEEGSFALSVIESARPLLDYYNANHHHDNSSTNERVITRAGCEKQQRPRSAGAFSAYPAAAAKRMMPVGNGDTTSKAKRLAAVEAAELSSAAAVCAAKAEKLLRRTILGNKNGSVGVQKASALPTTAGPGPSGIIGGIVSGGESRKVSSTARRKRDAELDRASCSSRLKETSRNSCGRVRKSAERCSTSRCESAGLSTERTSIATSYSSRSGSRNLTTTSQRRVPTRAGIRIDSAEVKERRTRLLAELETLRRRVENAEGLLREVDNSLLSRPKQRPKTATHRTPKTFPAQSGERGASTVGTAGNTSAKSSAGYGAFNLGERRMCPLVVTHQANAFLDES